MTNLRIGFTENRISLYVIFTSVKPIAIQHNIQVRFISYFYPAEIIRSESNLIVTSDDIEECLWIFRNKHGRKSNEISILSEKKTRPQFLARWQLCNMVSHVADIYFWNTTRTRRTKADAFAHRRSARARVRVPA